MNNPEVCIYIFYLKISDLTFHEIEETLSYET